ncbi:MAG: MFS transporter [Solirubrobacterales bacterium]
MGEPAAESLFRTFVPKPPAPGLGRLALAAGFSTLGGTMCSLTFAYLAFSETKSALAAVGVMVGYTLAYAIFAQPGSSLLRPYDRRWVVLGTDAIKLVNYSATVVLQILGLLDLPLIIAASAIGGLTSGAQYPAWQEILQKVAPEGKLDETNGLFSSASSIGAAIGALAGGTTLALFGPVVPLAFNVVSYLPLMFETVRLPEKVGQRSAEEKSGERTPARRVLGSVKRTRLVWLGILFMVLLELIAWPIISLLPKVASEFGSSAHIYGILLGAFYFGGVLVAGLLVVSKDRFTYDSIIRFSLSDIGLALILLALVGFLPFGSIPSIALAALVLLGLGIVLGIAGSVLGAIVQLSADPKIEGSILAFFGAITLGAGALGGLIEGLVADRLEIWWLPLASGFLIFIALLYLWSRKAFRVLDEADPRHEHLIHHHLASTAVVDAPYTATGASGRSRPRPTGAAPLTS